MAAVTAANLSTHPEAICYINPKHEHFGLKVEWLRKRFREGLKIKLLYVAGEDRPAGFIEYVPGEFAWRAFEAVGCLFVHCLLIYARKHRGKGLASAFLEEVFREAKILGKAERLKDVYAAITPGRSDPGSSSCSRRL